MNDTINNRLNEKFIICVGKYSLSKFTSHDGKEQIWIGLDDGEGGAFNESELEKVIGKFYDANF